MKPERHVNYDEIAPSYHERYNVRPLAGVAAQLRTLVQDLAAQRVLEVGCGTGRWLEEIAPLVSEMHGLDASAMMLTEARKRAPAAKLEQGDASLLPYSGESFDLVFCVNAIHHFDRKDMFIREAGRVLRKGGKLAVVGMDPHNESKDDWFVYQYFDGTYESDLQRHPSYDTIAKWMEQAGLTHINRCIAEQVNSAEHGKEVLNNHFLQKKSTTQLLLISDAEYAAGLAKIEAALIQAERNGNELVFPVHIVLHMITGIG